MDKYNNEPTTAITPKGVLHMHKLQLTALSACMCLLVCTLSNVTRN